jgi:hypothetical protein
MRVLLAFRSVLIIRDRELRRFNAHLSQKHEKFEFYNEFTKQVEKIAQKSINITVRSSSERKLKITFQRFG